MNLKLSPPWIVWQKKLEALFGEDPDIRIEKDMDAESPKVKLFVAKARKAAAIKQLLIGEQTFGGVRCTATVVPPNTGDIGEFACEGDLVAAAFEGNPVVAKIRPVSQGLFRGLVYCVFRHEVVQFFADRLDDINGFWSGLMEDIARSVLSTSNVFFCTATGEKLAAPHPAWP